MNFDSGYLYHIYNRGNNSQKIFFCDENYFFFLRKIKKELLPYCDILAYCLMPTHFHLMVLVNGAASLESHRMTTGGLPSIHQMTSAVMPESHLMNGRSLNNAIGILLRSYTRAINLQEGRTGSLFQQKTKAKCLSSLRIRAGEIPHFHSKTALADNYPFVCLNYIHQNPIKAGLVKRMEDWEYSSFKDYIGNENETICNKELLFVLDGYYLNYQNLIFIKQTLIEKICG